MEIRHLISFEKVAYYKSYSKAAQALFISQSSITAHINELERELDTQLFYRNRSPVQITDTGQLLLDYVKQIMELLNRGVSEVKEHEKGSRGVLGISVSESVFDWFLPFLNKFKIHFADIDIKLNINLSHLTKEMVLNREINIGIIKTSRPIYNDSALHAVNVSEDEGIIVFSKYNALAKAEVITKESLRQAPMSIVIYGKNTNFWDQVTETLDHEGIAYDAGVEMNNSQAVKQFLKKSNRIAFMPKVLVQQELDEGLLLTRPIQDFPKLRRYGMLIFRKDGFSGVTEQFVRYFLHELRIDTDFR